MNDWELLQQYAGAGREDAFEELAARHLDLVYSAALRQVRSPELAEEVAWSVFIDLARNARKLAPKTVLTPWLYQVTRRTSVDVIRRESRRQSRERAAADMNSHPGPWNDIEPLLDDAMEALEPEDRSAILLRYFENKSLRDVGHALGTSEDAAQKRVSRAIDRLRDIIARQGVATESAGLAVLISTHAIQSAPPALKAAILPASAAGFTKAIAMTAMQKFCVVAALAATVGTACYEARRVSALTAEVQSLRTNTAPAAAVRDDSLSKELDDANRRISILQSENGRLQSNTADLARLRGEVSQLRSAQSDPTDTAAKSWLARVSQLKARLSQTPGARIPEMQYLTDNDWLNAARSDFKTDEDFRRAMSQLRNAAEDEFVSGSLKPALDKFGAASGGHFPENWSDLQPYFPSPVEDAVLQRWEIAPPSAVPNVGVGPMIVTQIAPVDEAYDNRLVVGANGSGSTGGWTAWEQGAAKTLRPVYDAYQAANPGTPPSGLADLAPYATTPEQQAALQKALSMKSGNSASSH
ncbi:MAG TPA: sigma-70 family RNA polymerase sigma factor [Verrucomicrobiae bacterium]|jgi:RNA polymerase sigma factor (sigma-70 family)